MLVLFGFTGFEKSNETSLKEESNAVSMQAYKQLVHGSFSFQANMLLSVFFSLVKELTLLHT